MLLVSSFLTDYTGVPRIGDYVFRLSVTLAFWGEVLDLVIEYFDSSKDFLLNEGVNWVAVLAMAFYIILMFFQRGFLATRLISLSVNLAPLS